MVKNFFSEVKLRTDKRGIIQLLNTLLNNIGDFRQLGLSDSWELIVNTVEYINNSYSFNMLHFVDWEVCKSFRYFSKKQMKKRINLVSKITRIIYDTDNYYNLEFIIDYSDYNYFEKVVSQYPDSSWVIDNILYNEEYDDCQNGGRMPLNSVIMTNLNGQISIQGIDLNDISDMSNIGGVCPIHLGYVYLLKLYSDIILFRERLYKKVSESLYQNMFAVAQNMYNMEFNIWTEYKNEEAQAQTSIDCFSIFHITNNDKIERAWQCFNGNYCPIIEFLAAHNKTPTPKREIHKEIVLQPLWE